MIMQDRVELSDFSGLLRVGVGGKRIDESTEPVATDSKRDCRG